MISRRGFLKVSAATGGAFLLSRSKFLIGLASVQIPQTPLPGKDIPKFVEPLPVFGPNGAAERVTGTAITVSINEVQQKVLPESFYTGLDAPFNEGTYVWAYNVGNTIPLYPGITVEAQRGTSTDITYVNDLPIPPVLQKYLTVDQTLHWANPLGLHMMDPARIDPYAGPPPAVAHLHGAEVSSYFDGGPDQWFTPDGIQGPGYATAAPTFSNAAVYHYVNEQEAANLWFHDHTLGATRLNVFAGLAAFYLLRDGYDTGLPDNPLGLPGGPYEREIAIQDRQFDTNGQWLFPDGEPEGENGPPPNPDLHPFWNPEFFGDAIVVNGKSWPYFEVEPRRYRFRLLDGCNARFLELRLLNRATKKPGPAFWVIGTDGGLLDTPVKLNDPKTPGGKAPRLLMAPGERYDVIIDFSGYAGQTLTLENSAKAPYPSGTTPDPKTVGQIMQFRVTLPFTGTDSSFNPASGATLRKSGSMDPIIRLVDPIKGTLGAGVDPQVKRQLTLVEIEGESGPEEVLVNNTKWAGRRPDGTPTNGSVNDDGHGDLRSELPQVGSTEVWEIINLTMDAHPIHLHLTQFQLMNRQAFNVTQYRALYDSSFPSGSFIPRYGPPLDYTPPNGGYLGGNPDVTPFLSGKAKPPKPEEAGWKDTVKMYPGEVSRIVVRFTPQDIEIGDTAGQILYGFDPTEGPGYVWHCHIVDHEDNEMMRPYIPKP